MKKHGLMLVVFLSAVLALQAQDPFLQKGDLAKDEQARELVKKYDAELGLRAEQRMKMAIKIEEFLIDRENVMNSRKTEEAKLDALYELQKAEEASMRNILTGNQYPLYLEVREKIQPLKMVNNEEKKSSSKSMKKKNDLRKMDEDEMKRKQQ
ncbi:hypothetical protein GCM10009117_08390 [Gangjinia marincola]|uniref:OmpH family outer membrane protein n=1 Tax=Gangjinia marincola TaxID=578463 RepID=A0ABP3XQT8_9FLAO